MSFSFLFQTVFDQRYREAFKDKQEKMYHDMIEDEGNILIDFSFIQ
jgi:hypothetical protein